MRQTLAWLTVVFASFAPCSASDDVPSADVDRSPADVVLNHDETWLITANRGASTISLVDVATGSVALELVLDTGPRIAFGELGIDGLERYDRRIIEDLRPFAPGDPYSEAQLQEFQARLRTAGYFSSVSALPDLIALQRDPAADRVAIEVIVTELQRRRVVFGLGYSTDEGPRGQVGFEHRDILGTGLRLESALVLSAKRQRAFANFRTPYDEDNRFIGFGQRIEREDIEDLVTLRSNTYAGIGRRHGDIESFTSLQYQVERERIPAGPAGPGERNSQQALVLGHAWNLRRLDSSLCLLYTSPSPRDRTRSRMPSSA